MGSGFQSHLVREPGSPWQGRENRGAGKGFALLLTASVLAQGLQAFFHPGLLWNAGTFPFRVELIAATDHPGRSL